jgi:hypothetical protein
MILRRQHDVSARADGLYARHSWRAQQPSMTSESRRLRIPRCASPRSEES